MESHKVRQSRVQGHRINLLFQGKIDIRNACSTANILNGCCGQQVPPPMISSLQNLNHCADSSVNADNPPRIFQSTSVAPNLEPLSTFQHVTNNQWHQRPNVFFKQTFVLSSRQRVISTSCHPVNMTDFHSVLSSQVSFCKSEG